MGRCIGLVGFVLVLMAVLQGATAQTTHIVLDSLGWIIPPGGAVAYSTWASTKTFVVGDTLVFNFTSGQHDVVEVTKAAYDACNTTNPIGSIQNSGPANITLNSEGEHYYICTFGQHCAGGQKLAITVTASSGTATPPSSISTPPPSPPMTPGGPTSDSPPPSQITTPADCTPTPSSAPTPGGPIPHVNAPSQSPTTTPSSASSLLTPTRLSAAAFSLAIGFLL